MLIQIVNLILQVLVSIVAGACLLHCYLQWLSFNLGEGQSKSIGAYILPLSNWIVLPLRRFVPSIGRFDLASCVAAYLLILAKISILLFISGTTSIDISWLALALVDMLNLTLSGLVGLVFVSIILSWVGTETQIQFLVSLLVNPLLAPIRRLIPNFGALDLSPLALLLILQILQIVLGSLQI